MRYWILAAFAVALPAIGSHSLAAPPDAVPPNTSADSFQHAVRSILQEHCLDCHSAETSEAELDLSGFQSADDIAGAHQLWAHILDRVESGEMPPADAGGPLEESKRKLFVRWIRDFRQREAEANAGDPGPVLVRRLSNAEYDHAIRDLTGVDIRPTQTFPIDPANEAGFDNSGESLTMSPARMRKLLEAARHVAEYLLLTPDGIRFAPHPVVTDTDRDKYCVKRIVAFYKQQPTDLADYFFAAWLVDRDRRTIQEVAGNEQLSSRYLATVKQVLESRSWEIGPMQELQSAWRTLQQETDLANARDQARQLADRVQAMRKWFSPKFDNLRIDEVHKGSQSFVLWKNDQYAANRRIADFAYLQSEDKPQDAALLPPETGDRDAFRESCKAFCSVFPNAFYISERGRDYLGVPKAKQEKGRLLSAGFHSMMGYYRDDDPLCQLILDDQQRKKLDRLWAELDFITAAPQRQYQGFLWFERTDSRFMRDPQFDFARPENLRALDEASITRLAKLYLEKATRNGGSGDAITAIEDYFRTINQQIRWVEQARRDAEPNQLAAMIEFAKRAYRRALSAAEQKQLQEFYRFLREVEGQSHSEAMQDLLVSILVSPNFSYRLDLLSDSDERRPLSDDELASRLSFFLWASIPDKALIEASARGELTTRSGLLAQTKRMLQDHRMKGLATEFAANWLDIRRFEQHNSVDRERFPTFDDSLRQAMFEEPIRYFVDIVQNDRPVTDLLYGRDTFVNRPLAQHYGIEGLNWNDDQAWLHVPDAGPYGRGGLLPMAVFLTKNSPGLRTSPVKRGYWVVRRLLGEHIPPPPPDVPELPSDESKLGELTLRQALAAHRAHASCAGCHDRFDSIGIAFEGFGPVGERRSEDLGGRPIDTTAVFPDGSTRRDVAELRIYLKEKRESEFIENFARKLLTYALGRSLLLSDEPLIERMKEQLASQDNRFAALVETIVTSQQFTHKRGRQTATENL